MEMDSVRQFLIHHFSLIMKKLVLFLFNLQTYLL